MFSILNKTKNNTSLDWMEVDIHSHLLPGLDDGCEDTASAVELINRLKLLGISNIYTTPHICEPHPNNTQTISHALQLLQQVLHKKKIAVNLFAAAEYMAEQNFESLYQDELICLPGKHVLLEMPVGKESAHIDLYLFALGTMGYTPILAHPERYVYYQGDLAPYKRLKDKGALFQMNLLSPAGYDGPQVKEMALKLLKNGMIDLIGTNLHRLRDMYAIEKFVLSGNAHKIFKKNPIKNAELFNKQAG